MRLKSFYIIGVLSLVILFFFACQKQQEIIYSVPDTFLKYTKRFEQEAKLRGHDIDFEKTGLIIEFQNTGSIIPYAVGICYFSKDGSMPKIGMDETYWNSVSEDLKELTIFHELGHCALDRDHRNDTLQNGHWASILRGYPEEPSDHPLHYNIYRTYYLDELFDPSTPPPTRTSTIQLTYPNNGPLINYGVINLGYTQPKDILIENTGDGTLEMISLDLCPHFSSNFSSLTLAPNTQRTLNLAFTPTTTGIHTCNAYLNSNDPNNPQVNLTLQGIGVENNLQWAQRANFKGHIFSSKFSIGNKGYVINFDNHVWEYTPNSNQWIQKNDFPGDNRNGSTTFVINGKGYLALGSNQKDVWEYSPQTDTWIRKTNFPGIGRSNALSFVLHNKAYIAGGNSAFAPNSLTDFWEYDPSNDTWTQKQDLISPIDQGISFALGNKGYVGLGNQSNSIYEYDLTSNQWLLKTTYPGNANASAVAFVINNIAYLGTGLNATQMGTKDFWQYSNNSWQPITDFPIEKSAASAFIINNKAYVGGGFIHSYGLVYDFWKFTP